LSRIVKKASEKKAELIGKVDLGDQVYTIAADGNLALGLINGYRVVDANLYENPIPIIVPVMAGLIAKAYRDSWVEGSSVSVYKGDWDSLGKYPSGEYLEAFLKELSHLIGKANILVKEGPSDQHECISNPQVSADNQQINTNLANYGKQLEEVLKAVEILMDKTQAILRVKLIGTMWGISDVQKELEPVRNYFPTMEKTFNSIGQGVTLTIRAINRVLYRINMGKLSMDDKRYIGSVLVPDITNSFESIRKQVSFLLKTLAPLYKLERMFRTYTGNPVSWSIPNNLIIDFKDSFLVLVDFLADVPVIELSTMEPLEVVQSSFMKTLSEGLRSN
jgi:hypothetical protein